MKICPVCGAEFAPALKTPYQKYCCRQCGLKGYRLQNRERIRQQRRRYQQEHREQLNAYARERYWKNKW